jgi:hypothetical protein
MKRKRRRPLGKPPEQVTNPLGTIAGQAIPVLEAFWLAFNRARDQGSVEAEQSACLPAWCHHIADQFAKTVFKSMIGLDPKGQFDARNFGRMIGLMLRAGVFVFKEIEPLLRKEGLWDLSKGEERRLKEISGLELLFPIASKNWKLPIRNENQLLHQTERHVEKRALNLMESVRTVLAHLWGQSIEEQHQFLCGIPEGFTTFLDGEGQFTGDRGRTKLYLALLALWPEILEMQKAEPPKSRRDLQQWLIAEKQVSMVDNPDWFDHLCDEIGLVMKGVGRKANPEI